MAAPIYTSEDVHSEIKTYEFENGKKSYAVISKLNAHTCVNQADTLEEATKIQEYHITQLLQTYNPAVKEKKKNTKDTEEEVIEEVLDEDNFSDDTEEDIE